MTRVIGLAGWSGSGKTTLLTRLIPHLTGSGLRVSTIKHAHHAFDIDHPGKDSHSHRIAGATEVLIGSARRWALLHELREEAEPSLAALLARLSPVDLVIVEGFKGGMHPKIEIHRPSLGKSLLQPNDPAIIAIACDVLLAATVRILPLNDIAAVAAFVREHARPLAELIRSDPPAP